MSNPTNPTNVVVSYSDPICKTDASNFAMQHNLKCIAIKNVTSTLNLNFTPDYIELVDNQNYNRIHVDFLSGSIAHRQRFGGGKGQAIAKAIGLKTAKMLPTVLDATAGLAKDALVIASLGCPVIMLEQSAIVAKLVNNAIQRASFDEDFIKLQKNGFSLVQQNSMDYLRTLTIMPDVIYLDPMYPDRKKSALVKKNMQILQKLLGVDLDADKLLEQSLLCAQNRVVVKRPKGSQAISDRTPDTTIESKKTRYDIYFTFKTT